MKFYLLSNDELEPYPYSNLTHSRLWKDRDQPTTRKRVIYNTKHRERGQGRFHFRDQELIVGVLLQAAYLDIPIASATKGVGN